MKKIILLAILIGFIVISNRSEAEEKLRIGHFPNLTHAQALVAHQLSRQGKGWFESRLPGVTIEWYTYNAGPSAIEAMLAESIDLTYVGPNPALNAFARSQGEEIRIIDGAALGGSALLVRPVSNIGTPKDFKGKRLGTPQLGNSQDIMARAWLISQGLKVTQTGGDVLVIPTANPDQLDMLIKGDLDAVWTVEPWVSRLERDAKAEVYLEDRTSLTTLVATSVAALKNRRDLLKRFVKAADELTEWINKNPVEAKGLIQAELKAETTKEIDPEILNKAWSRIQFTSNLSRSMLEEAVQAAKSAGFMSATPDLSQIIVVP